MPLRRILSSKFGLRINTWLLFLDWPPQNHFWKVLIWFLVDLSVIRIFVKPHFVEYQSFCEYAVLGYSQSILVWKIHTIWRIFLHLLLKLSFCPLLNSQNLRIFSLFYFVSHHNFKPLFPSDVSSFNRQLWKRVRLISWVLPICKWFGRVFIRIIWVIMLNYWLNMGLLRFFSLQFPRIIPFLRAQFVIAKVSFMNWQTFRLRSEILSLRRVLSGIVTSCGIVVVRWL